ncbi:MAG: response regulator [Candidatus Eremiobacteraeota bacterium]|nr:response regulator [Candidatus Eremiobacteraeota bacterium]
MILLIEDDLVTCHIMTALLKRLRRPHVVAHDGATAVEHLNRQPIDLIIADLLLPDGHGLDLIERLVAKPYLQDIPVVFCTANADAQTVERALALGAVDFVKKPINVDVFAGRIERALKRAPARWESWREMIKRLRVDSRTFQPLLTLARDHLAELVSALGSLNEAGGVDAGREELSGTVLRMRGAALNVGAIRTVQLVDVLWSARSSAEDIADLHTALTIELAAFEDALQSRSATSFAAAAAR